ncbi:MAG TPA: SDR family NAD(P)-dependent oxidoreductase [Gemmatimonadales bacterium]|nr:SDR family NAD(P)-dependent oxidoreductase [Gemmatimonadales bacterium]
MPQHVALVTGATAGIGRATAFALGRAGYRVGVCARTAGAVEELVAELRADGISAAGRAADVGRAEPVAALVKSVTAELGPVDTLINNAGIAIIRPLTELSVEEWDATMATNLKSLFLVTRAVLPGMLERGSGIIVNVASLAGKNPLVGGTAYAASKHAVLGFSKSLMLEVRTHGVRVLAICPGSVNTALIRNIRSPSREGEVLEPEDVAQAILDAVRMPARATVSEIDIRPANP